jgi:hypothetical protein
LQIQRRRLVLRNANVIAAQFMPTDITDEESVRLASKAASHLSSLRTAVNCAGARAAMPEEFAALVRHSAENGSLNAVTIRLYGAMYLPPQ